MTTKLPASEHGSAAKPDSIASSGLLISQAQAARLALIESQVVMDYRAPGAPRHRGMEIQWVRNPMDGSIVYDHKGYPLSVDRILATRPLKSELCSRPGPGNKRLTYLSGEGVTRTLNEVFGYDGWNLDIVKTERANNTKDDKGRFHVAYTAHVRLTHKRSGTYKEDVGAGDSIDRDLGSAVSHAMKGAVTDALKRAARHFGDKLGNSLYQGTFSINKAPLTLRDALDQYDKERASSKFGSCSSATKREENESNEGSNSSTSHATVAETTVSNNPQGLTSLGPSTIPNVPSTAAKTPACSHNAMNVNAHNVVSDTPVTQSVNSSNNNNHINSVPQGNRTAPLGTLQSSNSNHHGTSLPRQSTHHPSTNTVKQFSRSSNNPIGNQVVSPPMTASDRLQLSGLLSLGEALAQKENMHGPAPNMVRPQSSYGRRSDPGVGLGTHTLLAAGQANNNKRPAGEYAVTSAPKRSNPYTNVS